MTRSSAPTQLLERASELRLLDDVVREGRTGRGRLVVIEGEAGIGKSALLGACMAEAGRSGMLVLRARATELERHYPYGIAVGLFDAIAHEGDGREDLLGGAAAAAEPLFRRSNDAGQPPRLGVGDPFAPVHGLYWLALNAAEVAPLLIAVDDAQWSDDGSLRFLHYLSHRIDELPIVLLLAFRSGPFADAQPARSIRTAPGAARIEPRPLSEQAIGTLLADAGIPDPSGSIRQSVSATTRGNAFFVSELIRALAADPSTAVIGTGPVPATISRFVEDRLARLDPAAQQVAEVIAILGRDATVTRAATLAGIGEDRASDVIRRLGRGAIVEPVGPPDFVHPIVRAAVYGAIPAVTRAHLHRRAALLLADDGAPLGVLGGQLLEAERRGDPRVVELLRAAAEEALAHGQPGDAAELLKRALEEPSNDARPDVLTMLARAQARIQSPDAIRSYTEVVDLIDDSMRRAELLLELGHTLINTVQWPGATEAFERGLHELEHDGTDVGAVQELRERLEAGFASAAWVSIDRHEEAEQVVHRILAEAGAGRINRELATWVAFQRSIAVTDTAPSLSLLVLGAIEGVPEERLIEEGQLVEVSAGVLVATDELEAEIDLLSRTIEAAERVGAYGKVGLYSYCRAFPFYYTGALTDAIADAATSIRISELGWETFMPAARGVLAFALLERGDVDGAADALAIDTAPWEGRVDYGLFFPLARGRIALARGDLEDALTQLEVASQLPTSMGFRALVPPNWRDWTAIVLSRLGRRDEARDLAGQLVAIGHEWGAKWVLGSVLRVAGMVEGGADGIDLLRQSEALLARSPAKLEHARSLVELGSALRRGGYARDARETLTKGMDLAHRLGAGAFVERARDELRAAGSRPRRYAVTGLAALTPAELRVAQLAAGGRTNRQVAQTLFVTPKAVEYHLANVFPKLGITSRHELAAALERGGAAGAV